MVEAIYALIAFAMSMLYVSFYKKDSTLIFFSGILFLLSGLDIYFGGFGGIKYPFGIAVITSFIGLYLMIRVGIEMIADKTKQ